MKPSKRTRNKRKEMNKMNSSPDDLIILHSICNPLNYLQFFETHTQF